MIFIVPVWIPTNDIHRPCPLFWAQVIIMVPICDECIPETQPCRSFVPPNMMISMSPALSLMIPRAWMQLLKSWLVNHLKEPLRMNHLKEPLRVNHLKEPLRVHCLKESLRTNRLNELLRTNRLNELLRTNHLNELLWTNCLNKLPKRNR